MRAATDILAERRLERARDEAEQRHRDPDLRAVLRASVILEALRASLSFIEEEAEQREQAGSEMSDYEREPRELVEQIRAAIELAQGGK